MNILIVNQYAPPDPSPTARLAGDLGRALEAKGCTVRYADADRSYVDRSHRGVARLFRELRSLVGLAREALAKPAPDVIACFCSPP